MAATRRNIGHDDHAAGAQVFSPQTAYFAGISMTVASFDPKDSNAIYLAGSEFALRTLDGGSTFTDVTALQPDSSNPSAWRGRGYSGLCSIWFAFHPTDPARSFLLAMDAGKLWQGRDSLKSWTYHGHNPWPWGGGNDIAIAGQNLYATFGQHRSFQGIGVSTDDGKTFDVIHGEDHGLPKQGSCGEPKGIYAVASNPSEVFATVGDKLLHSIDSGQNWKRVSLDSKKQYLIAGDPKNPMRFFVSTDDGFVMTQDGGKPFLSIGGPGSSWRSRLSVDSNGRLLACSWRGSSPGRYRYDAGPWTRLLDENFAFSVSVDPTDPTRIALSTSDDPYHDVTGASGIWISTDDGKSWSQANDGLGMLRGQVVTFNLHNAEELVLSSFGGGYYKGNWPRTFKHSGTRLFVDPAIQKVEPKPQGN